MSTIVAISTPPGSGGIGIIRLSGKESFNIVEKIFKPKNNSKINTTPAVNSAAGVFFNVGEIYK